MCGTVFDGFLGVVEFEEAELESGGEGVATADAVEDFEAVVFAGFVEVAVVPEDGGPVVDGGGDDAAEGSCGDFEVGEFGDGGFDHFFECSGFDFGDVVIDALDFEAEGCGEVLFVADHDIDVSGDFAVHFAGFFEAADGFPEGWSVVEVVGDDGAVFVGGFDGLDGEFGGGLGEGGVDAAGVEPADAEFSEDVVPVDVAGFEFGGGGVAAVGVADGSADAEAAFGEVEAVADGASDAVVLAPLDEVSGDAALHDEVLDEVADFVVYEGGDDGGFETEGFFQSARGIVFAAAFPCGEVAGGADSAFAGIEAEHDFAEGNLIKGAFGYWFDGQWHGKIVVLEVADSTGIGCVV